jgi:hypothetical protein
MKRTAILPLLACLFVPPAGAEEPTFEQHVRPLLKAYCFECHGEGEKLRAGLDLRLRRLLVKGGDGGPAVVAGKPDDSPLVERVASGMMPPGKKKLEKRDVELLRRWVAAGARTTGPEPDTLPPGATITAEERTFWAFQPVRRPEVPKIDTARNPVDVFLLARLREKGLSFSLEADRRTLIRRATFDLRGLPPTPEEVEAFENDKTPEAYEKLIDRLLASPRYGERWGRHWLDVAGYADSEGYSADDPVRGNAWKYRDYVIRAFNADMPFDRFVREQLAGDEMVRPPYRNLTPEDVEKLVATGFLRMAPDGSGSPGADPKVTRNQVVTDTIKTVSSAFLGVTVGCAQCHNHRHDPIPQADFYRLRAILEPAFDPQNWQPPAARQVSLLTDADREKAKQVEAEAAKIDQERLKKQNEFIERTFNAELAKLPEEMRDTVREARNTPGAKRTAEQKKLLQEHPSVNVSAGSLYLYDKKAADELKKLADDAAAVRARKPVEDFVRALTETPGRLPETRLFHRGDPDQPKAVVAPGGLTVLGDVHPLTVPAKNPAGPTSGRRLALANWITDPKNPLTARVLVNRIWMHHFGAGLVRTPGDFGRLGERPTHPELLDWLASEFREGGWSVKKMHRLLMTSSAYRQASRREKEKDTIDPDNRLLGRMAVRRLEAEAVRDAVLAVSGKLSPKRFGPPVPVYENDVGQVVVGKGIKDVARGTVAVEPLPPGEADRRSVYVQVRRSQPLGVLEAFDAAVSDPNCELRNASTVAPQALLMMNSEFAVELSEAMADRLRKEGGSPRERVVRAWRLAFSAEPTDAEAKDATDFLAAQEEAFRTAPPAPKGAKAAAPDPARSALATFCQALFGSNRFLYVD